MTALFPKNSIIAKVLKDVESDVANKKTLELLDDLLDDIEENEYDSFNGQLWHKNGLYISELNGSINNDASISANWYFIETEFAYELSWLIEELIYIFKPKSIVGSKRLLTTLGFLFNLYSKKYESIDDILRAIAVVSVVWLHPDHIVNDRFYIQPIKLPDFGNEF